MKKLLVTRSSYDDATSYLFYYAGLIIKEAKNKGIPVMDLKRPRLTRKNFTNLPNNNSFSFIFFNAHGDEKTIYGDKIGAEEEFLIRENINHNLLNSKLVYARACSAAASLGRTCSGCFIGYKIPFSFWIDGRWSTKPSNDNTAKLFLEPSNLIVSSLLKGNTAEEAVKKSKNMSKKNISKLLNESQELGAVASIMLLWDNMDALEIIGDEQMTFE